MTIDAAFAGLNAAQREAATHGEVADNGVRASPLLVIAGAGTGKTNTLAHRVAHFLLHGVAARAAAAAHVHAPRGSRDDAPRATRRRRGAGRSKARRGAAVRAATALVRHLPRDRQPLIRQHAQRLGLEPSFSVLDRGDAADLMDVVRHRLGFSKTEKRFPRKDTCLGIYSHRINSQQPLRHTLETAYPWCLDWEQQLTDALSRLRRGEAAQQALDYDDLLLYWHVMMGDPALAREIGAQFDHVLVDEYQDTNRLQAEILLRLKPDGAGVTVVGDDAQSIYSFRGATVENILDFPERFSPPAHVVTLEENYRSTQPMLDAANALMAEGGRQFRKFLRSTRGGGAKPRYCDGAGRPGAGRLRRRAGARVPRARHRRCVDRPCCSATPTTATCSSSS